jgi:methyl-accepting chemotaxis protein
MMTWIKNRKLWQKIVLTILFFVTPLTIVTLYFVSKGVSKDVAFARQEIKGNVLQRPLEAILTALPQHLQLALAGAGAEGAGTAALAQKDAEIEKAFADLAAAYAKVGADLQFTDDGLAQRKRENAKLELVKRKWDALRAQTGQLAGKELMESHKSLIADVRTMITHAGDTSNLILDPDLDSYYLMDVTLLAGPQTQDRLGAIMNSGQGIIKRGTITSAERLQLGIDAALLKEADADRISGSISTALNEDKNFYGINESLQSKVPPALKAYTDSVADSIALIQRLATDEKVQVTSEEWLAAGQKSAAASYDLWRVSAEMLDELLDTRARHIQLSGVKGLAVAGFALLFASVVAFFVLRAISRPLTSLTDTAERIAQGDNTARATVVSRDEIGQLAAAFNLMVDARVKAKEDTEEYKRLQEGIQQLLMVTSDASDGDLTVRAKVTEGALGNVADAVNLMLENVGGLLKDVHEAATRVASSATEIQASTEQLNQGSVKQTSEIINTTSAVQEMAANIESVSSNAQAAAEAASRAKGAAEEGAKVVKHVTEGMERIRQNVQAGAKKIKRLGERSMEISSIVSTISQISAQTDMLALNAAIEAARAGEHGRGFTVVAEEVRKLAERAAAATKEIEKLIAGIQAETNESVTAMEQQTAQVEEESASVANAGNELLRIRESSVQSAELINEINLAAKQQVRGATGVVKAMEIVSSIAQQAQTGTGQTRRATETLTVLSGELAQSLSKFKVGLNGNGHQN